VELEPRLQCAKGRRSLLSPPVHLNFLRLLTFFLQVTPTLISYNNTAIMPKSKRAKVVHLTKTDKKGKELSQKLFANVQEAADNFEHIFVFSVENMRNSYLKEVRAEFSDSR
jgi:5S rRNA maturation endonuclease (ribonuclease M5)